MFVVDYIYIFVHILVMRLPVTSVLLDSIRLTYFFYDISVIIFLLKMAMPLYDYDCPL